MVTPPPSGDLYAELKSWQGGIGALLGFFALVAGALLNFHLNRRRDDRLRIEEARSVAAALGEILLLRKELARLAIAVAGVEVYRNRDIDQHFLEAYPLSNPLLYKALAPKVGLLDAELIVALTEFHKNFQEAKTWLPLFVGRTDRKYSYSRSAVLEPARDAVNGIIPALRTIERVVGIAAPAGKLDLGYTETIIDNEQDLQNTPPPPN